MLLPPLAPVGGGGGGGPLWAPEAGKASCSRAPLALMRTRCLGGRLSCAGGPGGRFPTTLGAEVHRRVWGWAKGGGGGVDTRHACPRTPLMQSPAKGCKNRPFGF